MIIMIGYMNSHIWIHIYEFITYGFIYEMIIYTEFIYEMIDSMNMNSYRKLSYEFIVYMNSYMKWSYEFMNIWIHVYEIKCTDCENSYTNS